MSKVVFDFTIKYHGVVYPAHTLIDVLDGEVGLLVKDGGKLVSQSKPVSNTAGEQKPAVEQPKVEETKVETPKPKYDLEAIPTMKFEQLRALAKELNVHFTTVTTKKVLIENIIVALKGG